MHNRFFTNTDRNRPDGTRTHDNPIKSRKLYLWATGPQNIPLEDTRMIYNIPRYTGKRNRTHARGVWTRCSTIKLFRRYCCINNVAIQKTAPINGVGPEGIEPTTFPLWAEHSNHWITAPKNPFYGPRWNRTIDSTLIKRVFYRWTMGPIANDAIGNY